MNSIPSPVASEQGEGRPVPYAVYQRAQERIQALLRENTALRQENNAYRRELAFLDQVDRVSGKTMSPGQKATFRATRRQLIERGADGTVSTAIDIWKIAKDTGQGNKTVGRHIKYCAEALHLFAREERTISDASKEGGLRTEVLLNPDWNLIKTPGLFKAEAPRNHGGERKTCPHCGSDKLQRKVTIVCTACGGQCGEVKLSDVNRETGDEDERAYMPESHIDQQETAQKEPDSTHTSVNVPAPPVSFTEEQIDQQDPQPLQEDREQEPASQSASEETPPEEPLAEREVNLTHTPLLSIDSQVDQENPLTPPLPGEASVLMDWLHKRIGEGQLIYATGKPDHADKYKTKAAGYQPDLARYLQGHRRHIYGSRLRSADGTTAVLAFDLDEPEQTAHAQLFLEQLSAGGAFPLFWQRQNRKGHLELYFDQQVDPRAAYQWALSLCPALAEIPECYPIKHTDNRTNHPLSWPLFQRTDEHVVKECAVSCWIGEGLLTLAGYASDPQGVSRLVQRAVTPSELLAAFAPKDETPEQSRAGGAFLESSQPASSRAFSVGKAAGAWDMPDLAKAVIADFNRTHPWEEIAGYCGGLQGDRFCAVWRGERSPSVVIDQQGRGEYACDYGRVGNHPKKLDKYEVWCLANGINKKRDLAERLARYRKGHPMEQEGSHQEAPMEAEEPEAAAPFFAGEGFQQETESPPALPSAVGEGPYPPPQRPCLVCGRRVWVWTGEHYECGSGDPAHEGRL